MGLNRRGFLILSSGLAGSLLLPGRAAADEECQPTKEDILGPYFRPHAPRKTKLRAEKDPGQPLLMSGTVRDERCEPVEGAVIELWQADSSGQYDNDPAHKPEEFVYRASIQTDGKGGYAYETVVPGLYEIGQGVYRPKHIHYKVSAPGFRTLVTQAYFRSEVPLGRWGHPSLLVEVRQESVKGEKVGLGTFPVVLARK